MELTLLGVMMNCRYPLLTMFSLMLLAACSHTPAERMIASNYGNETGNRNERDATGLRSLNYYNVLCDDCKPSLNELKDLKKNFIDSEKLRADVLGNLVNFTNDEGNKKLDAALIKCGSLDTCSTRLKNIKERFNIRLEENNKSFQKDFVEAKNIIEQLDTIITALSKGTNSMMQRGIWLEQIKPLRIQLVEQLKQIRIIEMDLTPNPLDPSLERNVIHLFSRTLDDSTFDKFNSLTFNGNAFVITSTNNVIDKSCPDKVDNALKVQADINLFGRYGHDADDDMDNAQAISFLNRSEPLKIKCEKVFTMNSLKPKYLVDNHTLIMPFKKETSLRTDSVLGIFGGVSKSTFYRYGYFSFD